MNQPTTRQGSEPAANLATAAPAIDQPAAAPAADRPLIGAIEAGGTKMVLACGHADGTMIVPRRLACIGRCNRAF